MIYRSLMKPLSGVKRHKSVIISMEPVMTFAAESESQFEFDAVYKSRKAPIPNSTNISERCLTIFYAGSVNVYDDVPQAKAEAIMKLAAAHTALDEDENASPAQNYVMRALNFSVAPANPISLHGHDDENQEFAKFLPPCHTSVPTALRLARKASLAQFLRRRKARLMAFYSLKERCLSSGKGESMTKAHGSDANAMSFGMGRMEREEIRRIMEDDANGFGTATRIGMEAPPRTGIYFTEEASKHYNHRKETNMSQEEEAESACSTAS